MYESLNVLAVIPARGGSKRIPRKNIKELAGRPLICYSIDQAKSARYVDRVIVSTDDEEIVQVARECGAEVPFLRPKELAGDDVTDLPVFQHVLAWLKEHESYTPDIVVQLRPTSPLRKPEDIDGTIELLVRHPDADSIRTVAEPEQSPYKMYRIGESGYLEPLLRLEGVPESFNLPQQKLPKAYKHVGYIDTIWSKTIKEKGEMTGSVVLPYILKEAYSGINTPEQWDLYEYLIQRQ